MSQDLTPAIIQDVETGSVLMLGWMNPEARRLTEETGLIHFWSRSRGRLWMKGETSGNTLALVDIKEDCDSDALLVTVRPAGPVCHTGTDTCWGAARPGFGSLDRLWQTIVGRRQELPEGSYTTTLLTGGPEAVGRKVSEEAVEVLLAAKDHAAGKADDARLAEEVGDLLYHLLVLCAERNLEPSEVFRVLDHRRS